MGGLAQARRLRTGHFTGKILLLCHKNPFCPQCKTSIIIINYKHLGNRNNLCTKIGSRKASTIDMGLRGEFLSTDPFAGEHILENETSKLYTPETEIEFVKTNY